MVGEDWPSYTSHKVVRAMLIAEKRVQAASFILVLDDGSEFTPTEPGMAVRANVGDYAVLYEDGFRSVSPRDVFEKGYTRNE